MVQLKHITPEEIAQHGVVAAPDTLKGKPAANKAIFDRLVRELVAVTVNEIIDTANVLLVSEDQRGEQEAARVAAELLRVAAETARDQAEETRVRAEAARVLVEEARVVTEEQRVAAEDARVTAEQARVTAETLRVVAEQARVVAENARETAETARKQAESGRVTAEEGRDTKEGQRGQAESRAGFKGLVRKMAVLVLVFVAVLLDRAVGVTYIRTAVCFFFIANEGISILENMGLMGVPYPKFLKNMLEALRDKADAGEKDKA